MATKLGKLGVWAFIDDMTATFGWGDEQALRARLQAHWDAGANHVCIQTFKDETERGPDLALLELLAPMHG